MTDRPILFSAPMIKALLAGQKTQTRRLVNPQPFADGYYEGEVDCTFVPAPASNLQAYARFGAAAVGGGAIRTETFTPRMQPGDTLWVREAWRASKGYDAYPPREMSHWPVHYEADGTPNADDDMGMNGRLRASMHMPRWASRLTLTVTDVRVQRLQDISEEDARAEGVTGRRDGWFAVVDEKRGLTGSAPDARSAYAMLWGIINGTGSWAANPWVVAYSFTVERRNIDEVPHG